MSGIELRAAEHHTGAPGLAPAAPGRLLLLGAHDATRETVARVLGAAGHEVHAVDTLEAAIDGCARRTFDVLLIDEASCEASCGADLRAARDRLRREPATRHVPVVAILAADALPRVLPCLTPGTDDHVLAPVEPLLLDVRVCAVLAVARAREADRRGRRLLERELEIGREIQAGFLPDALPDLPGYELATAFEGARQVSGDFYDAFLYEEELFAGVVVGDVCGKGVGAALFMALFRTLIRAVVTREVGAANGTRIGEGGSARILAALRTANDYIARVHGRANMFATVFAAGLHPFSGKLWYVNAGHEPGLIVASDGGVRATLPPTGAALGMLPDLPFTLGVERLQPGETLLLATDGVSEARAPDGAFFGEERLLQLCEPRVESAAALVARITGAVHAFAAGLEPADDLTLVAVHRSRAGMRAALRAAAGLPPA